MAQQVSKPTAENAGAAGGGLNGDPRYFRSTPISNARMIEGYPVLPTIGTSNAARWAWER